MSANSIPFLDLVAPHKELETELTAVFQTVMSKAGFIGGPMVENFEKDFATFCDAKFCVGVASGTDALLFAFMAAGIQAGDAVITVPNTFIATTEAISQSGARPYFVDIDEKTYTIDPAKVREFLAKKCSRKDGVLVTNDHGLKVKAIVPVHLYGQMADMDPLMEIAEEFGLIIVEDACQAHGAEYYSKKKQAWLKAGSVGFAAAFSFYPGKNLGACGEAGAVTTNDDQAARKMRMIRDHGQAKKYYHDIEGYNGRLDALQAGFLHVKLPHLAKWNSQRLQHAKQYNSAFAASGANLVTPHQPEWSRPVYHLYVVRVLDREKLQKELAEQGIGTGIHYPVPLHQQKAYAHLGYKTGDFPITERTAPEIVSLPMFPQMTETQVKTVAAAVANCVASPLVAAATR